MIFDDIKITRSKRKTIALHVHQDGSVEVRAPLRVKLCHLEEMVEEKQFWINRKLAEISERKASKEVRQLNWQVDSQIPFLGGKLALKYCFGKRVKTTQFDDILMITSPEQSAKKIKKITFDWMKTISKEYFQHRTSYWKAIIYPQSEQQLVLQSRKMCSRWGSCSRNKSIRLNTLLMMLPEHLIDYVIVHELCHWQVFNHSRKFYSLMEKILPDWKLHEQDLKKHQYLLSEVRK